MTHERQKKRREFRVSNAQKKKFKKRSKAVPTLSTPSHYYYCDFKRNISNHFHHRVVKRKRQRRIKEEENDNEESKKKKFKDDEYKLEFFNGVRKRKKRASDAKRTVDASFRIVRL